MSKQIPIEWLIDQVKGYLWQDMFIWQKEAVFDKAKSMSAETIQDYARFCIQCDRENLPLIDYESYIKEIKK